MADEKKAPDAVTSKGQPESVVANGAISIAEKRETGNGQLTVKTAAKQEGGGMSELPGFTAPPIWTFDKYNGRLIAGEREYKGRVFFELRLWAGEHGDKATRKGVTVPIEAVGSLADALAAYAAALPPSDA